MSDRGAGPRPDPDREADPGATAVWPVRVAEGEAAPVGVSPARVVLRALPALVLAGLLGWWLEWWVGGLIVVVATTLTVVSLSWAAAGRRIEAAFVWVGVAVGRVLSLVVLLLVFLVVFVPVGVVSRVLRRDLLGTGSPRPGSRWLERWGWTERRLPDRSYASERDLLGGRRAGRLVWSVGLVALVLAADVVVGAVLTDPAASGAPVALDGGEGLDAIPALADLDYAPALFHEQFVQGEGRYDALLGWRMADTSGRYLNIVDGERVSRTTSVPGEPVVVWFFGGSATYGFGQRDEHTIPSELVRLAEEDGVALEAHNFGAQAYVNWQAVSLFAQLLTEREPPDLAVFYDGYNDLSLQFVDGPVTEPSHALARVHRERLEGGSPADSATTWRDVRGWWADRSAVTNLYRRLRNRLSGDEEPDLRLTEAEPSLVPEDVDAGAVTDAADDLLRRGRDLATALGEEYGVEVQSWFQPTLYSTEPVEGEVEVLERVAVRTPAWVPVTADLRSRLPDSVLDLGQALDGRSEPLFWDAVHTNEQGARLVAEAAWPTLRDALTGPGPQS